MFYIPFFLFSAEVDQAMFAAATQGHPQAQYELGSRLLQLPSQNHLTACLWLNMSAQQGHGDAQKRLEQFFSQASAQAKSDKNPLTWLHLGKLYSATGNIPQACTWFRQASRANCNEAQSLLCQLYKNITPSTPEDHWLQKIADQENDVDAHAVLLERYEHAGDYPQILHHLTQIIKAPKSKYSQNAAYRLRETYASGHGDPHKHSALLKILKNKDLRTFFSSDRTLTTDHPQFVYGMALFLGWMGGQMGQALLAFLSADDFVDQCINVQLCDPKVCALVTLIGVYVYISAIKKSLIGRIIGRYANVLNVSDPLCQPYDEPVFPYTAQNGQVQYTHQPIYMVNENFRTYLLLALCCFTGIQMTVSGFSNRLRNVFYKNLHDAHFFWWLFVFYVGVKLL